MARLPPWVRHYPREGEPLFPPHAPWGALPESPLSKPLLCFFAAKRPVSPYSGYNGQLLTSVYQPTEMALMHKGPVSGVPGSLWPQRSPA